MSSIFQKNFRKIVKNYFLTLKYKIYLKQNALHYLEPIFKNRYYLNLIFITRIIINKLKSIFGLSNLFLIKINNKTNLKSKKNLLYGNSKYIIQGPKFINLPDKFYQGDFKKIYLHHLYDVLVNPYSSSILQKNNLYIDDIVFKNPLKFGLSKSGLLFREYPFIDDLCFLKNKFNLLIKKNLDYLNAEKGILIGGCGSQTWYHWLIECLPKLFIAEKLPKKYSTYPLILPDICRTNKNFKESLIPFNIKKRKIIYIKENEFVYVKNLVTLDDISVSPFNLRIGAALKIKHHSFHSEILFKYFQKFHKYADIESKKYIKKGSRKRIFLVRKNSKRKYNQDELLSIAEKYDFEPFYLEELDLKGQIKLISKTSHIIGPSGSAWSCLIFNNKYKIKGLSWLPDYLAEACNYSALAYFLGHDLRFIRYDRKYNKNRHFNFHTDFYTINKKIFEKGILEILKN